MSTTTAVAGSSPTGSSSRRTDRRRARDPTTCRARATRAPARPRTHRARPGTTRCGRRRRRVSAPGPASERARCQLGGRRDEDRPRGAHDEAAGRLEHRRALVVADQTVDERGEAPGRQHPRSAHRDGRGQVDLDPGSSSTSRCRRSRSLDPSRGDEPDLGARLEQGRWSAVDVPDPGRGAFRGDAIRPARRPGRPRSTRRRSRPIPRVPASVASIDAAATALRRVLGGTRTRARTRRSRHGTSSRCDGR